MLRTARRGAEALAGSADAAVKFLQGQIGSDGGFTGPRGTLPNAAGRAAGVCTSDLYYTVFGLEGLLALGVKPRPGCVENYLRQFGDGESLDFIHLCCLARCRADLSEGVSAVEMRDAIARHIEATRTPDGGYSHLGGARLGTAYGCFLAVAAYQDLGLDVPDPDAVAQCVESLAGPDGGYVDSAMVAIAVTPTTAAALTVLQHLHRPADAAARSWLLDRCDTNGGFHVAAGGPLPDLLSTATALHALAGTGGAPLEIRPACSEFVRGLQLPNGGFHATRPDRDCDCEYTYYALLALGHLS